MTNKYVALEGGLDLVTPTLEASPGKCVTARNCYESVKGGYQTLAGYERFDGQPSPSEAATPEDIEVRRALIGAVPGDGPIRGVAQILGELLAWRNSGAASVCYRSTEDGWVVVPNSEGTTAAVMNTTISYINHNFYGGKDTYRMYIGDGINPAQEYDPVLKTIKIAADSGPVGFVVAFNERLIMSSTGGTFLASVAGDPLNLDGTLNAVEIGVGDEITGFAVTASESLAIYTLRTTWGLTGSGPTVEAAGQGAWKLQMISQNAGAKPHCIAQTDDVFASDNRGIGVLSRTQKLGGFSSSTITDEIQPLFKDISVNATCATTIRSSNHMRFYYGNTGIVASQVEFNANGNTGIRYGITETYYPDKVLCVSTEEDTRGKELSFFGSDNGFVYQIDKGRSFDGEDIEVNITLQFNHFKSPSVNKRFMGFSLETILNEPTSFDIDYTLNDGTRSFEYRTANFDEGTSAFGSSEFGTALFGARPLSRAKVSLKGTGYNLQLSFSRNSSTSSQSVLTGYTIRFTERGQTAL